MIVQILTTEISYFFYLASDSAVLTSSPQKRSLSHLQNIKKASTSTTTNIMANPPKPLVICGPSGVGKSTIIKRLTDEFPGLFGFSVSHTTRKPRNGECDGVNYHYVTREEFLSCKEKGDFIETAEFSGNMYGTSKMAIQNIQQKNQICILDIEMQGVKQIKKIPELDPNYVFIQPPSIEELERRLIERKTETEESLKKRLDTAKRELEYGATLDNFDIVIVNDNVDKASGELRSFMIGHIEKVQQSRETTTMI